MEKDIALSEEIRSTSHAPILLFWQYTVIAIAIGIVATRYATLAFFLSLSLILFMAHLSYSSENTNKNNKINRNESNSDNTHKTNKNVSSSKKYNNKNNNKYSSENITKDNNESTHSHENIKDHKLSNKIAHSKHTWKQSHSFILRTTLLVLFILLSFFYTTWRNPALNREDINRWDEFNNPMQYIYIEGEIHSVQGLPSNRLRLVLKNVRPLTGYQINPPQSKIDKNSFSNIPNDSFSNTPKNIFNVKSDNRSNDNRSSDNRSSDNRSSDDRSNAHEDNGNGDNAHARSKNNDKNKNNDESKNNNENKNNKNDNKHKSIGIKSSSLQAPADTNIIRLGPPILPGMLNFTWDKSPYFAKRPMSGQSVIVRTRIRNVYGGITQYWQDRHIWHNAWLYGNKDIFWIGDASHLSRIRETLRHDFITNIFTPKISSNTLQKTLQKASPKTSQKASPTGVHVESINPNTTHTNISINNNIGTSPHSNKTSSETSNKTSSTNSSTNSSIRENTTNNFNHNIDSKKDSLSSTKMQARAILPALLFGDRFYLTSQTMELFNGANLLHSLALSGQHLALTGFLATLFVFVFIYTFPQKLTHTSRRKYILYFTMPLAFAYILLGNAPLSLLRAFIMLSIAGLFWLKAKVFTLLDCLFLALLGFCLWWPNSLFDLGVQLSFVSVFAIALFMPYIRLPHALFKRMYKKSLASTRIIQRKKTSSITHFITLKLLSIQRISIKTFRALSSLIMVSFIIQICTMPFIISYFGKTSYFFILNVLWLPVLGFIVLPFAAFALIFSYFEGFSQICIDIASYPAYILLEFLIWLQSQGFNPFLQSLKPTMLSNLGFYIIILFFCYFFLAPRMPLKTPNVSLKTLSVRLKPLSVLLLLGIGLLFSGTIERHFIPKNSLTFTLIDVGQGQAVLLEGKNGRILLDTGGANSPRFNVGRDIVAHYLTENEAPKLQYAIASHDDSDHINGLGYLLDAFSVTAFMESYLPQEKTSATRKHIDAILEKTKLQKMRLGMGDVINMGDGFYLQVFYPPYPSETTEALINPKTKALTHTKNEAAKTKRLLAKPRSKYSSNNGSLVMRLVKNGRGLALICGDVENSGLKELVRFQKGNMWTYNTDSPLNMAQYKDIPMEWSLQADLLILPHHGSKNSFLPEFYEQVKPSTILASSGRYNRFGFPATSIQDYWKTHKKELLSTAKEGNIKFMWNGKTLEKQ